MELGGKTLGILISSSPGHENFKRGVHLAEIALRRGVTVYLYCLDEAVRGVEDSSLRALQSGGLKLFACAYAAERRNLPRAVGVIFSGLSVLSDVVAETDRFVSFN